MNRRTFLHRLGAAAALVPALPDATGWRGAAAGVGARTKHWVWLHSDFKTLDDWKRALARMRAAGIDAVLIGGGADFYRGHIPAAAEEGIEVHAWTFTMMRGGMEREHPEWYAVSRTGVSTAEKPPYVDYYKFLCPAREPVQRHLRAHIRDLAGIEGLGSIHLDYIRYPDVILPIALWPKYGLVQDREYPEFDFCYCSACRERFARQTGIDPLRLHDPPANEAWVQYRYDSITYMVSLLFDEARAHGRPLTAAVFPTPAIARRLVRQDWTRWKVDAVFPMVYHSFYKEDVAWIGRATREGVAALGGRIPLYSGLYVPDLPPRELARAAALALDAGANGVSLFEGRTLTQEHWRALTSVIKRS